jgi:D-glycerate 3-kinase
VAGEPTETILNADWSTHGLWLARHIAARHAGSASVIGICGAQGSGKSTLSNLLRGVLAEQHGLRTAILSLDDLYLTRSERQQLARHVHPLLATRGVPGTHDVVLGAQLLRKLRALCSGESLRLPYFVKAADERAAPEDWPVVEGPIDVILFEGWCVGVPPQTADELPAPVNELEANEDADGRWRRWVNERLIFDYPAMFALIDELIFLQVPDWDSVFRWRQQQEADNAAAARSGADANRLMDAAALRRFLQHYERLTRHALRVMPARADVLVALGANHGIVEIRDRAPS